MTIICRTHFQIFKCSSRSRRFVPALLLILGREIGRNECVAPAGAGLAVKVGVVGIALGYSVYWIARAGPYF